MTYELEGRAAHPLSGLFQSADFPLADLIPSDALEAVFGGLYYTEARAYPSGDSSVFDVHVAFEGELALEPAGDEGPAIVFGETDAGWTVMEVNTVIGPQSSFSFVDLPISLRIPPDILRDVETDGPAMLTMTSTFTLGSDGGFTIDSDETLTLAESEVANSGVTVSAGGITWNFDRGQTLPEAIAAGITGEFIGLGFQDLIVKLPPDFVGFPQLSADYCCIGTGGISGRFHGTFAPEFDEETKRYTGPGTGELFGIPFALFDAQIEFKLTALTKSELTGKLLLPFFDEYCDVVISINLDGSLSVRLSAEDGLLTLTKPNLLTMKLDSIEFEVVNGVFKIKLGGEITPLFGGEQQGNEWPSFRVDELSIDSTGDVHLDGGWLNLREKYTAKFQGFELEVSKLGFGKNEDGGKWIGFTGGVKLAQGMPAGASVEGLRLTWYPDGRIEPSLNGVRVNFEVPNTLKFAGEVSYDNVNKQFLGAVELDLIALNMQVDATAVFGINEGQNYLAIYLAAEFPAGIPLFATGLGVYGMAGLFALNMEPDRAADKPWYALPPQADWFHEEPVGVTALEKWKPVNGSMAFGAGVTLGTVADNGHTFSGKMLLAIVFPGPILVLQGGASMLQERTKLDEEPNFRALAVLDGRAGTLSLGLDAQYRYDDEGSLIDIHGSAEGFFNFNDPNAWRLNVGQKEPRDRRLTARAFKLFDSFSYLMLNPQQLEMGAWVGFKQQWVFGPLSVNLEAWIEGNARVSWKPAHFYGDLWVHGSARLSAFGFGVGLTVDAKIAADVFDPLMIFGQFNVAIDLPWPLSDVGVDIQLQWGPQPTPPPFPLALKEVAVEHFKASTSWPLPRVERTDAPRLLFPNYDPNGDGFYVKPADDAVREPADLDTLPIVPLDCRPHITFARNINDDALVGVNAMPLNPEFERIGDPAMDQGPARVRYGLKEVVLEKRNSNNEWDPVARKGTDANQNNLPTLYGSWAPVPQMPGGGGSNVGQVKLWLWSKTPFEYTRLTSRMWDEWFTDENSDYPCQTVIPKGWDFEAIDADEQLPDPWMHPDEPRLLITQNTLNVIREPGLSIRELDQPSHGLNHAFGISGNEPAIIVMPEPTNLARILITDRRLVNPTDFFTFDETRQRIEGVMGGTPDRSYVDIRSKDIDWIWYRCDKFRRFPLATGLGGVRGSAYNPELNQIIFVEWEGNLSSIDVASGLYTVLGTGYNGPMGLALSSDYKTAYITENEGTLLRVDLTSDRLDKSEATLITKGMSAPHQIALDEVNERAYVIENGDPGRLLMIDLKPENLGDQKVILDTLKWGVGLILADDRATAYITELGFTGRFSRVNLDTRVRTTIYDGFNEAMFLSWANDAHDAVLTMQPNPDGNSLLRMDLAGKNDGPEFLLFNFPGFSTGVVRLPNDRYVVCSDKILTMFATTLLIPEIIDVGGSVFAHHFEEEFVRWQEAGEVLEPHTKYRLKVTTAIHMKGEGQLDGYEDEKTVTEFAYFRTAGPPGVAQLTAPAGSQGVPASEGSYVSSLNDLSRYVRKTMPRVVEPTPTNPLPSGVFYRAYDIGIEFDENYVDLMYRIGRRDLSIQLHNANGAIRGSNGRRLVLANQWGKAETVTLKDHQDRWLSMMGSGGCEPIPIDSIVKDTTFTSNSAAHVLPPSSLCEARLIPALLHDDFGSYGPIGVDGPGGRFGRWQVSDLSGSVNSHWQVNPGTTDSELVQTKTNVTSALVYVNAPTSELPNTHPDQPFNWTDLRLTVHLQLTDGRAGVVFRYRDAGQHYRLVMEIGKCELIRVSGGQEVVLASSTDFTLPTTRFSISVEATASTFNVYQGSTLLLSATDPTIAAGSVGFYTAGTANAKFTDIYVDDFSSSAPVVYRFSFMSSRFKNFKDQIDSFEKETLLAEIDDTANVAPFISAAGSVDEAATEAESRAFDGLLALVPDVAAPPVARITRVEQNDRAIAFLVQTPEPFDWKRTHVKVLRADLNTSSYNEVQIGVLRKADGSGLMIVAPDPTQLGSFLPPGEYRFVFKYRRDNRAKEPTSDVLSEAGDKSPEEVTVDLPWETQEEESAKEVAELLVLA